MTRTYNHFQHFVQRVLEESKVDAKSTEDCLQTLTKLLGCGIHTKSLDGWISPIRPPVEKDTTIGFSEFLADYLFKCSVQHSLEHLAMASIPVEYHPMDIDQSPFYADPIYQSDRVRSSSCGFVKQWIYHRCFEHHTNNRCCYDTRLVTTHYGFEGYSPTLARIAREFRYVLSLSLSEHIQDDMIKSIEW